MNCPICTHAKRADIEKDILAMQFSNGDDTKNLQAIADTYKVKYNDLLIHMLMHISTDDTLLTVGETPKNKKDEASSHESLASQIKRKEADILYNVLENQTATFKNLSAKLNAIIAQHTDDKPTLNQITKPVVEMYLGTGNAIRATVDEISKMNLIVNGEKNDGLSSLAGLVQVLKNGD